MGTHEELITALKFDESFKDMMRDYYSYGFKNLTFSEKSSRQTLLADWKRINNILVDYMKWSDDMEKAESVYRTQAALDMSENPFHRFFRFCKFNHSDPMVFFNIIFALSHKIEINEVENLSNNQCFDINLLYEAQKRSYYQYINFIKENQEYNVCMEMDSSKKKYFLKASNGEQLAISKKDIGFVNTLFRYWKFINEHSDIHIEYKVKEKKRTFQIKGTRNKKEESITGSGLDEADIVNKIIADNGKLDAYEKLYCQNIVNYLVERLHELFDDKCDKRPLTSAQLQCFYPRKTSLFSGDNNGINSRLFVWEEMEIIKNCPGNRLKENRWKLCELTIGKIIKKGKLLNPDFENRFRNALDFYSRYYILGICGTYLLDRLGKEVDSPFRFRHEYFMTALNDFNLIDLLYAIENNKWCKIRYKHGIRNSETILLGKPLELRLSSESGREYLVFYNPLKRCCISLKLEFMEEIIFYEEENVLEALETKELTKENVANDIKNAKQALKYSWGVSVAEKLECNVKVPVVPGMIRLKVEYDPKTEYYIRKRLLRESRRNGVKVHEEKGELDFIAKVADRKEMNPWLRSLYSRIKMIEGIDQDMLSLEKDIDEINRSFRKLKRIEQAQPEKSIKVEEERIALKGGEKSRKHEELFNEIFSAYYYIPADVILQGCGKHGEYISEVELKKIIKRSREDHRKRMGFETGRMSGEEIKWQIANNSFGKREKKKGMYYTKFKYSCEPNLDFYRDILPLTRLEIQWLKTILDDSKMRCFLYEEEIWEIQQMLNNEVPNIEKLPMDKIVYYDRYLISPQSEKIEQQYVNIVINGIQRERQLDLKYTTENGKVIRGKFKPLVLEFSKRNSKFQLCAQSCEDELYYYFNLSQINSMEITEKKYDYSKNLEAYKKHRKNTEHSVKIEFYDVQNIVDKILTEFSPWRKYCLYDNETELYTLTIFYQEDEELELVVRLMGYGSKIHFVERENNKIAKEIEKRLEKQLSLLHERGNAVREEH